MRQLNFNNQKSNLSESDIDQIVSIITHRCRIETTNRVRSILTYSPSLIPSYGIFERLIKEDDGKWHYCAGQSYPDEIRTLRELVIKG
jgi:hypothetical protein